MMLPIFLLFFSFLQHILSQDIITIAGNYTSGGYSGDGGVAISAKLKYPTGVAVDSLGNVYISDTNNNVIRKITVSNGIISTVVGTGATGFSGDTGTATSAKIYFPYGVSTDASDNLYVSDYGNQRIRKVASGIINTFAGSSTAGDFGGDNGVATSAKLNMPHKVAFDSSGNVYIADYGNNRIRKVDIVSNIISTVAGSSTSTAFSGDGGQATAASFHYIYGIALDSSNNIYVADAGNNRIRMISASTGIINTICGLSTYGWSGDGGLAVNAILNFPMGVSIDSSDNIYISDSGNNAVRKITSSDNIINTIAGSSTNSGFSGDNGPATVAKLYYPYATTIDSINNVYIVDYGNCRIRKVIISTYTPTLKPSIVPTIANMPSYKPTISPSINIPTNTPSTGINSNSINNNNDSNNKDNVGIVVGVVIGVIVLSGICAYIYLKYKNKKLQTIQVAKSLSDFNNATTDSIDYGNYKKDNNEFNSVVTGNIMHLNSDIEFSRTSKDVN